MPPRTSQIITLIIKSESRKPHISQIPNMILNDASPNIKIQKRITAIIHDFSFLILSFVLN